MKFFKNKIVNSIYNIFFYLLPALFAPFIFKNFADKKQAGMIAGALFTLAALRAVRLSVTRPYSKSVRVFFLSLFFTVCSFWIWRSLATQNLAETYIFGHSLTFLHPLLSALYFSSFGILLYSELRFYRQK